MSLRSTFVLAAALAAAPVALRAQAAATPASLPAGARAHSIDRAHSEINFTASSRLLDAHGTFDKWDAEVAVDSANPDRSVVRITIDASSINTRVGMRDNHLRSPAFLDVAQFPTITFVSRSVQRTGDRAATLVGDLTMHGVTKPVSVPVTSAFYDGARGRFRGTFTLSRKEFGVTGNSGMNPIEDMVEVQFNFSLAEKKPAA